MELRRLMKILHRWWWLGVLPVLVVGAYVVLTYRPPAPTYQVVMRFTTGSVPQGASADYDRYYTWLTSEYIANGLADVARTGAFAESVGVRLASEGVEIAPALLQGALASDNAQSVLVVYLTWPDPEQLLAIAHAVSAEITEGGSAYYPQLKGLTVVAQQVDDPVPVPISPSLPVQLLGPALKLALAAAVGLGLIALVHYLDPMIRSQEDVESLDVPVLVTLPRK